MTNLLPDSERKRVLREYSVRRLIVVLVFVCLTGVITAVALLPSYMHVQGRKQALASEYAELEASAGSETSQEYARRLAHINRMISILEPRESHVPAYVLIEAVLGHRVGGISIRGMSFEQRSAEAEEDASARQIRLSIDGEAMNRGTLTAFVRSLEESEYFDRVDLPVSNFAARENIEFSMTLTGTR